MLMDHKTACQWYIALSLPLILLLLDQATRGHYLRVEQRLWRPTCKPEPVQGEHAIELIKNLINLGFERDAFTIHKDVPFFQQSRQIEQMVAPFHHSLPDIHPSRLVFPPELHSGDPDDLQTMADYMSQLNYAPDEIMQRLEEERQKSVRGLFDLQ